MTHAHTETTSLHNNTAYRDALLAGTSASSRRAYTRDLRYFWAWAELALQQSQHYPVSLNTVITFILDHTGAMAPHVESALLAEKLRTKGGPLRIRTLRRYLASLSVAHVEHGFESPTLPEWHLLKPRTTVIPAQAGIQNPHSWVTPWIPACAGMTKKRGRRLK